MIEYIEVVMIVAALLSISAYLGEVVDALDEIRDAIRKRK